jgi:hypothetical protein
VHRLVDDRSLPPAPPSADAARPGGPRPPEDRLGGWTVPEETLEWIIEQIERRVLDELERRGLRHNPGVF